jgi:tol-pal system protein YbgF
MTQPFAPARSRRRHSLSATVCALAAVAVGAVPACTPPSLLTLRSGLDSLRAVVDTMSVRDSLALTAVQETRRELAEQRDILLSTRATAGSTTQELFEQMQRLEGKLDEVMGRFQQISQRAPTSTPSTTPGAPDPNQLYDQAAQDLTQGRYTMALQGFRDFVQRFPTLELTDNARYGIGECYFAQSQFDSAAAAYALVDSLHPGADKVPAAMYKLALCNEKLGRPAVAKKQLEALVKRFPLSGEAQLARERLGTSRRR